jgi:hypothetical protein
VAQVVLERDVPLEEGGRGAELAPDGVRHAQKGRRDHLDRTIAEGSRDAQGLLAESDGLVVVASDQALDHHEGGNPREPVLVAERPGQHLRLVEVLPHARPITERVERVPEVDVDVDGQLGRLRGLGEAAERPECLLEVGDGLAVGGPRHGAEPRLEERGDRLLPQLPAQGVMGQPLGLLGDALGRESLDGLGDVGVQGALPVVEQPAVRDVVGERVLERVLAVRKEPGLVEELRGLQVSQLGPHLGLRRVGNGQEQRHGHVLADDGSGLEQSLGLRRQAVDTRGQNGLNGGGDRQVLDGPGEPVGAALADEGRRLHQSPHTLLEEEGIRFSALDQQLLERAEGRVRAEERIEQLVSALGRQGVDTELAIVGLAAQPCWNSGR